MKIKLAIEESEAEVLQRLAFTAILAPIAFGPSQKWLHHWHLIQAAFRSLIQPSVVYFDPAGQRGTC